MLTAANRGSIKRKFMLAMLATTCAALLVASIAMLALDLRSYQTGWLDDLQSQADILAGANLPALEFGDAQAAAESLAQLEVRQQIVAATILKPDGEPFASYVRKGAAAESPKLPPGARSSVSMGAVRVMKPVTHGGGETLGYVWLTAQYPIGAQMGRHLMILSAVMAGSLLFALLVSSWLQGSVTRPILALTAAANRVISGRDFSLRVEKRSNDEVGILVDAFNTMLSEVGERAQALEQSNATLQREMRERMAAEEALRQLNGTLEERIAERTRDLERAHAQLRQSQKLEAVGQLTGGVAHDFNNVLQVIAGNLQLLQMSFAGNPEAQRRLETAAFAADRGAKLAAQLLAFARRQPLQPMSTNVGRTLRGMDDLLRRALGESIHIETVVAGGLWTTMVDPHQLENVILNLAINARDAMAGSGRLTLELGNAMLDDNYIASEPDVAPGQYVLLAISDTGCGMTPEVMARAFEPFFTTKREGEGTGLGLSMAYGFVKQSNGHIRIYSEVGSGTTIKIYLPRSMQPEVEAANNRAAPIVGGNETILVVEDDAVVQATVVDMLQGLGYRVLKANDGQSALTILRSGIPVDLVFTDVVMPGPVRSVDMARQARQMFPDIAVLFTSGYTQNAIVHGGRLDPGVELISKPYRREDLARKIRQILGSRGPQPALYPAVAQQADIATAASALAAPNHAVALAVPNHASTLAIPKEAAALSVLVVEDNRDARLMLVELLTALGHRVESAGNAEDALALLQERSVDVLLTDITLPGMSGLEMARRAVRAGHQFRRIVFSSGHGASMAEGFEFEYATLPKPFDLTALQTVLAQAATATHVT
ncbi:response regulator [Noviherbaspirillum pedocola]|uniref:histidine kinase n=1 Tax=Noviherbaspirillum pedocola TaxID=2801341 RepID=A0A934SUC4_9BURK|nr:response regulator [Noviherbaspirillum pedocola]MBK4736740.1 response regulator [Noviherbaspirillum pedocola]